jgi:hypothetical protein
VRTIARRVNVDWDQWKALVAASLKVALRTTRAGQTQPGRTSEGLWAFVTPLITYTLYGGILALFIWISSDLFLAGFVAATYTMVIVALAVLLDHNEALISTSDYAVLGHRPISSRTYFAARLAGVLIYTSAIAAVLACLPVVALLLRHGMAAALAGTALFLGSATVSALAVLLAYGALLHAFGARALSRALSYAQLGMGFFAYGGIVLAGSLISVDSLGAITLHKTVWVAFAPGGWFASYLQLASGARTWLDVGPALLSVLVLGGLVLALGGRLSVDYSARLAALASTAGARRTRARRGPGWWFRRGETRAMVILIKAQYRNDQSFRMTILGILPLTILYMVMGVREGRIGDPFIPGRDGLGFITLAILLFPQMLQMAVARSPSFRASWIFFACPAERARLIQSTRTAVLALFFLPYLAAVAAILLYFVRHPLHVLVHVSLLGLVSYLMLQASMLLDPVLPFSRPVQGRQSAALFLLFGVAAILGMALIGFATAWLYQSWMLTAAGFAALLAATRAMDWLIGQRISRRPATIAFLG